MKNLKAVTKTGQYVGFEDKNGVVTFLGIPYAKPPQRWKKAEELEPSDKVFEAKEYGPACWQHIFPEEYPVAPPMSEDCLTLNVWTNDIEEKGKPTMVWIHGGSYQTGSNRADCYNETYIGDSLVADCRDIVYVNINYRVNHLGSLYLDDLDDTGEYADSSNLQTLDQTAALKWIHENIEAFGGDSDNITIFGQSAGGTSVATLVACADANRYFSKAISQSSAFSDFSRKTIQQGIEISKEFRNHAGAHTLPELLALTPEQVIESSDWIYDNVPIFGPCECVRGGRGFAEYPLNELRSGVAKHIKVMTGTTSGEFDTSWYHMSDEELREVAMTTTVPDEEAERVVQQYIKNDPNRSKREAYMDLINDMYIRIGQVAFASAQASTGADVYMYYISYIPEGATIRPQHCFEIPYVADKLDHVIYMNNGVPEPIQGKNPSKELQVQLQEAWVNFARCGNPNGEHIPVEWTKYTEENMETMVIDYQWEMKNGIRPEETNLTMPFHVYERK